jgi:hypothetical protein
MPFQALAAAAVLLAVEPHGNRFALQLDHGAAEILWASPGSFRFRRVLDGALPPVNWTAQDAVPVKVEDSPAGVRLRTSQIEVTIRKRGVLLSVRRLDGGLLVEDLSEPSSEAAGVVWERHAADGSEFYGLGPRNDSEFGLLGKSVRAEIPLLVSTAGYGEFHEGAGSYRFDFTSAEKYRVQGSDVDYCFYFGPNIKEVFEAHNELHNESPPWTVSSERFGTWAGLRTSMVRILQGGMTAATTPVFDLSAYSNAPAELKTRARQLGSLVARVVPGSVGTSGFRQQLETFFGSYIAELQDRGFPVWHPLPFQYPDDREAARHIDEFLLGDEMLVAPILDPGNRRAVWLPRGVWTNLETNETVTGPKSITVETQSLPVWAKNGSIIPLDSRGSIALHYFPSAGGEFFLLEGDIADYSQAHAAPALDFMRLQIESKKEREYQWVVHHVDKPASVGFDQAPYREVSAQSRLGDRTWWWDPTTRNLHVRVKVKAGEDCIVNVN